MLEALQVGRNAPSRHNNLESERGRRPYSRTNQRPNVPGLSKIQLNTHPLDAYFRRRILMLVQPHQNAYTQKASIRSTRRLELAGSDVASRRCVLPLVRAENRKRLQLARIHLHEIFPPRFRLVAQAQAVSQVDPAAARSSAPRAALRAPPREPTPDVPEDQPATPEEPTPPATGQQPYCIISIDSDDEVCEVRARSCPAPSCVRSVVVAEGVVRLFG